VIPLPVPIQNEQVKAEFKNGVLTLTLPKVTEASHSRQTQLGDSTDAVEASNVQMLSLATLQ